MWAKILNQSGSHRKYIFQMEWQVTTTLDAKIRHTNQKEIHTFYKIYPKKSNLFSEIDRGISFTISSFGLLSTLQEPLWWQILTGGAIILNNKIPHCGCQWILIFQKLYKLTLLGLKIPSLENVCLSRTYSSEAFHPHHHGGSPFIQILC